MKTCAQIHICIAFPCNNRAYRQRLSGALRYLSAQDDIVCRIVDIASLDFDNDCRRVLAGWPIDGIIYTMPEHLEAVLRHTRPGAAVRRAVIDSPCDDLSAQVAVRFNARQITDPVIDLLLKRGFLNLGFLGTHQPADAVYSNEVESQFAATLRERGRACSVFHAPFDISTSVSIRQIAKWATSLSKPCGVLCYSDELARDLLDACRYARISVPEQIAIVGIDDSPDICEQTVPTLTSILPDFDAAGYLAAELLVRALRRKAHGRQLRGSYGVKTLTERLSTRDLRGCGRIVSQAMEKIRTLPLTELTADKVARSLNLSRRLLEIHFKKIIGRGIHAEILRRRLDTIRQLLVTTSEPINLITESCGFRTAHAAQIAFKKRFGMPMNQLRCRQTAKDGSRQQTVTRTDA